MSDVLTREKVTQFLNDKTMSGSVFEVLMQSFIKSQPKTDVHTLAAERIAISLLQSAWKDLEKLKNEKEQEPKKGTNPGI